MCSIEIKQLCTVKELKTNLVFSFIGLPPVLKKTLESLFSLKVRRRWSAVAEQRLHNFDPHKFFSGKTDLSDAKLKKKQLCYTKSSTDSSRRHILLRDHKLVREREIKHFKKTISDAKKMKNLFLQKGVLLINVFLIAKKGLGQG